jgi:cell division protein FtsB
MTSKAARNWAPFIFWALIVLIVVLVGYATQVHFGNEDDEQLRRDVAQLQQTVDELDAFVDELREETPSEQERNDAITRAVQIVPEIRGILCEAFPGATACAQD